MVTSFNWKSCGPSDPISADVVILPDPLVIPGNISVEANATLKVDVVAPVKVSLTIKKKVLSPCPHTQNTSYSYTVLGKPYNESVCVCVHLRTIRCIKKRITKLGSGHRFKQELDKESQSVLCVDV